MERIEHLRNLLGWKQPSMAAFLRVDQSTVSRIESGRPEYGPISRLLDQVEAGLASGLLTSGMSPDEVRAALMPAGADSAPAHKDDAA
jgi:transcriptional regulator with XRE-family HTH domain